MRDAGCSSPTSDDPSLIREQQMGLFSERGGARIRPAAQANPGFGALCQRAVSIEIRDPVEMVSLGRAAAPGAKRSRWRVVQGIQPQRVRNRNREVAEVRSAIHEAKERQP